VIEPDYVDEKKLGKGTTVFEKINTKHSKSSAQNSVTREFLKKYISYSKS